MALNDLVLEGFVNSFGEKRGLTHLSQDELFEAFATSSIQRLPRGASVYTATRVRSLAIVGDNVLVPRRLHLFDRLEPRAPGFD